MEFGLDKLFCWQTAVFSFTVWIITFGSRRVLERAIPVLTDKTRRFSGWWGDMLVPAMPVLIGVVMAGCITKTFPYPEGLHLFWGRLMFGAFCGLISSKVYQIVWGALKSKVPTP
jgi:hypothetical protein